MSAISFTPRRTGNEIVDRNLDALATVVAQLAATIPATATFASFVATGSNGVGSIPLPPLRDTSGAIIRRATVGSRLIAAVNCNSTPIFDNQRFFEAVLSQNDQIQQTGTANLSALTFLFVVVN